MTGCGGGGAAGDSVAGGAGVSSIVECFPVVHGGIWRNSSNVRNRGLQHFQPATKRSKRNKMVEVVEITNLFAPRGILAGRDDKHKARLGR